MMDDDYNKQQLASFVGGEGLITRTEGVGPAVQQEPSNEENAQDVQGSRDQGSDEGTDLRNANERTDDEGDQEEAGNRDDFEGDGDDPSEEIDRPKNKRSGAERYRRQRERAEAAEARAAALEARLAALEQGQPQQELTPQPQNENMAPVQGPDPSKYRYGELDPAYIADLADFRAEQKLAAFREELLSERQQEVAVREAEALRNRALEVAQIGTERYADFNEVVVEGAENDEWPLTETMLQSALESDKGPDILYYLATNPDEAERVARMDVRQQDRWFGRMEAKFDRDVKAAKTRTASQAPAPVTTARGAGGKFAPSAATTDFAAFERLAMGRK